MEKEDLNEKFADFQPIVKRHEIGAIIILLLIPIFIVLGSLVVKHFNISKNDPRAIGIFTAGLVIFIIFAVTIEKATGPSLSINQHLFYYTFMAKRLLEKFESTGSVVFLKKSKSALRSISSFIFRTVNYSVILDLPGIEKYPKFQVLGNLRNILNKSIQPRLENQVDLKRVSGFLDLLSQFYFLQLPETRMTESNGSSGAREEVEKKMDELYKLSQEMEEIKSEKPRVTILSLGKTFENRNILIRFVCWFIFILPCAFLLAYVAHKYFSTPISLLSPIVISISILGPAAIVGLQKPQT